ncbi:hypothetical protein FDECE_8429 [Fusarium decemcellulare]|nr:hypothetical protein FDECE_8429 [Fusarium decemcellulare]
MPIVRPAHCTRSTSTVCLLCAPANPARNPDIQVTIMSDKRGGKILAPKDMDFLDQNGKEAQRRREKAVEKRQQEEVAKLMSQDAGTDSRQRRGKGFV